jgi:hypothetical protein
MISGAAHAWRPSVESCPPCHGLVYTRHTESVCLHWVAQPLWASEHYWASTAASKGRRRSPVTLAIRVQSSRVNGLAWAAPQASGLPGPASSPSFPSTSAVIRASVSVGEPGLSARGTDAPPAEPGDRVGGPNATWSWVVKATMVTCPSCRRLASRVTNVRSWSTAKRRHSVACFSFVSTSDACSCWGCGEQRAEGLACSALPTAGAPAEVVPAYASPLAGVACASLPCPLPSCRSLYRRLSRVNTG